jgi:hypothetical protein
MHMDLLYATSPRNDAVAMAATTAAAIPVNSSASTGRHPPRPVSGSP